MKKFAMLFAVCAALCASAAADADVATIKLVERVDKTSAAHVAPEDIDPFLDVDADSLPDRLRDETVKKQDELRALYRAGKKKKAAKKESSAKAADEGSVKLAKRVVAADIDKIDPKDVDQFLALKPETLPADLRDKVVGRQVEINALIRLHGEKKRGAFVTPEACDLGQHIHPFKDLWIYIMMHYEQVTEEELKLLENRTRCTQDDFICRFTLEIFYEKNSKKPRELYFNENDIMMAFVAAIRGKNGTGTNFFGMGAVTCENMN